LKDYFLKKKLRHKNQNYSNFRN